MSFIARIVVFDQNGTSGRTVRLVELVALEPAVRRKEKLIAHGHKRRCEAVDLV